MEDSAYCRSDFVAIGGKSDSNKKRICGQQSYRIIELATPKNPLEPWVLEFQADSAGHQRGFSIRVAQILCSDLGWFTMRLHQLQMALLVPDNSLLGF